MGGKPFQSKGCKNCKRRKVKCDTGRPECRNCVRRGVQCEGYEKKLVFVYQQPTEQGEHDRVRDEPQAGQMISMRPPMPVVMNSASAHRNQIVSSYINIYFPDDIKGSIGLDPWYRLISEVSEMPNKPIMLEKALAATSCIYIGRTRRDNHLLSQGLQLYNGAIRHVSHQLSRNNYTDELFFTLGIFQVLATLYCPAGLQSLIHQTAVTNGIFQQCFRHVSNSPLIKTLCLAFQRMRLLKALSPLEAKSGVELIIEHSPDELISDEDQAVDELFHLMAGIAPVSAALGMTDLSDEDACHLLLQDTLAHRGKLLSWYSREMHRIGGAPSVGQSNEFPSSAIPSAEHLFGLPYRFPTLDNARIHIIYWAALSILQELIGQVYAYTYPFAPVDINNKNKEHQLAEYYADEISRGIPYCLQDRMKAWGASSTIFGMGQIAKVYMELGNSEKFKWSQELFKHEAELGSDLAYHMHHLLLFSWDTSQKARQRALSPESWGSMSHPSAAATPPSPVSSLSSASTAPFKEEYAALPGTIIVPVRPKLETDEVEC